MTPRGRGRLAVMLGVVTAGVLVQAALAGMFLGGDETLTAHTALGSLLPWSALVPAVVAARRRSSLPPNVWIGAVVLPVALWVQMVLGHVPWSWSTAVHVPLGVSLFGGSLLLTTTAMRSARSARENSTVWTDSEAAAMTPATTRGTGHHRR